MSFKLPILENGPLGVGIAAVSDVITDSAMKLQVPIKPNNEDEVFQQVIKMMKFPANCSDRVKAFMIVFAIWVLKEEMHDEERSTVKIELAKDGNKPEDVEKWLKNQPEVGSVATCVFATKINFVMMNHHVGQEPSSIVGYAGKVARALGWADEDGFREALWVCGHWLDTKKALVELGYSGVSSPHTAKLDLKISDDMKLRIAGGVAGAGKFLVYRVAYNHAKLSYHSIYITIDKTEVAIEALFQAIKTNPLRYHVGSKFLTGQDQISSDFWSEAEKSDLSCYVYVNMLDSTLSKSPNIMKKEEITGSMTYTNMQALKAMLVKSMDPKVVLEVISSKKTTSNNLAIRSGMFTQEELDAAEAKLDGEKI